MNTILEVGHEIGDTHFGTGGVEFARAVRALDPRVIHKLDIVRRRGIRTDGDGKIGDVANGGVAHGAFKCIVGVAFLEALQGLGEPGRWFRLGSEI